MFRIVCCMFDVGMDENIKRRVSHLQQAMKRHDVKIVIAYSNGKMGVSHPNFLYYISGYRPMGPDSLAVIHDEGESKLYVLTKAETTQAGEESPFETSLTQNVADAIASEIKKANLKSPDQFGFVGLEYLEPGTRYDIEKKTGFPMRGSNYLFEEIGRGEDEVELMRNVGKMADSMLVAALEAMKPGMTEYELVAEMEYASRMNGADDNFTLLASGTHNVA